MATTDALLKALSGTTRKKTEEVPDRDGLSLRLSPKGKITFQMRYRYNRKQKRIDLGGYPLMTLKSARVECQRLREKLEQGLDPKIVRDIEKTSIITAETVADLFGLWYESYCKENKAMHTEIRRTFEIHVLPSIGHIPAKDASLHHWLSILEEKAKSVPAIASRILINAKQMLNWAVRRQVIDVNPLASISGAADLSIKKGTSNRILSDEEIAMFWLALQKSRMAEKNRIFLRLCLFYGCRNGELRLSKKSDFDFNKMVWIVPPENHKTGKSTKKPLVRPIIPEVLPLIKTALDVSTNDTFLFGNSNSSDPMGRRAPLSLPYNIMQWLRKNKDYEMAHWSVHDLRKTARTNFSTLTEPHIAEIMLGHKLPGHWQVYDQYDYMKEQAEAYTGWWHRLETILAA